MSKVLLCRNFNPKDWNGSSRFNKIARSGNNFAVRHKSSSSLFSGKIKIGLAAGVFLIVASLCSVGISYIYQVNSIATKGYEIKDMEKKIQELNTESQKLQIKEVELKSMYNIEKSTQDLNLVNSAPVTYLEMRSPVAMK